MSDRSRAFAYLGLAVAGSFAVGVALTPWAEMVALVLIIGIAVGSTLFAVAYMFTTPWWTTPIGRGLLVSSSALALLADVALLYRALGDNYALRDAVRVTVFLLILLGVVLKIAAYVVEKVRAHRAHS